MMRPTLQPLASFPDPMLFLDQHRVGSPEDWQIRRTELKELFQLFMYGYFPLTRHHFAARVTAQDRDYFSGRALRKEIELAYGPPGCPKARLLLVAPAGLGRKPPVILGLNFGGNAKAEADGASGRHAWPFERAMERGYAVATLHHADIDPDRDDFTDGVHPWFAADRNAPRDPVSWGTIAAWAWGLSRAVDYLVTDPDVDGARIIATGHSRLGKTALLAAAFDERIAAVIPHQSGCGGAAPSRSSLGESVTRINAGFPHWFAVDFRKFNDRPEWLPFDQHCLIALVAPRPILLMNAVEDEWANPPGQFHMLKLAAPAWRTCGALVDEPGAMPEPGQRPKGLLGCHIRPGPHSCTAADWEVYLDWLDGVLPRGV